MQSHVKFIATKYCASHQLAGSCAGPVRVDDLTCCRALFAAWVFLYHVRLPLGVGSFWPFDGPVGRGYLGVDAFFVLSGMVLAHAHPALRPAASVAWRFWLKRLLRIYPVHLATTFMLIAVVIVGGLLGLEPRDPGRFTSAELARHLLLVHGWGLSGRWAWNYPSWSISTEWAGYLAFPLLWLLLQRVSIALCLLVALTMLIMLACVDVSGGPIGLNLTFHGALARFFPEFVAGMAAARLAELGDRQVNAPAIVGSGLLLAAAALFACRDWLVVAGIWLTLTGVLVGARQQRPPVLVRVPLLRALGEISFAFYMSFAVVETVQAFAWRRAGVLPAEREGLFIAMTGALTLGLALALRAFVEQPALRFARSLATRAPDG